MDLFKDIVQSILVTKEDQFDKDPEDAEKSYVPYVVNKALSFHLDCILTANMMNCYPSLNKKLQNDFLLHSVRSWRRPFAKWLKVESIPDLQLIMDHYGFSKDKAKEVLRMITPDQLETIKKNNYKGGRNDQVRRPKVGKA